MLTTDDGEPPLYAWRCPKHGTVANGELDIVECPESKCSLNVQQTRLKTQSREEWKGSARHA